MSREGRGMMRRVVWREAADPGVSRGRTIQKRLDTARIDDNMIPVYKYILICS
jgi:hypothetical protein